MKAETLLVINIKKCFYITIKLIDILVTSEKEILQAAEDGNIEKLKLLLIQDNKLVNCSDQDGYTPLHRACYSNKPEAVDLLLSLGADVSAKTEMQWQPLHSCCQWNNKECAVRLIQHGADVNACSEGGR